MSGRGGVYTHPSVKTIKTISYIYSLLLSFFVEALKAYEAKTKDFCKDKNDSHLFQFFIKEHKPVCSSTIARWLKPYMQKAVIDTSCFNPIPHGLLLQLWHPYIIIRSDSRGDNFCSRLVKWRNIPKILLQALAFTFSSICVNCFGSLIVMRMSDTSKSHVNMETKPSKV